MESIKKWLFKNSDSDSSKKTEEDALASESDSRTRTDLEMMAHQQMSDPSSLVDPKVAEFFKEFPEPYRQRLIERYSSREGIYKYDFIRDLAMKREYDFAGKGVLLEQKREQAEFQRQHEEQEREKRLLEFKESRKNREVPEWEKSVQSVIPLQENETMGLKLFQAANLSVLGFVIVWASIRQRKSQPQISKFRFILGVTGSLNLCAICQTAAVYRLMDWGVFDQTIDDRDIITKAFYEIKKSIISFQNTHLDNKTDT